MQKPQGSGTHEGWIAAMATGGSPEAQARQGDSGKVARSLRTSTLSSIPLLGGDGDVGSRGTARSVRQPRDRR